MSAFTRFARQALLSALALAGVAQAEMPRMDLTIGFYRIDTEVAADNTDRQQGLMHRKVLGQHQGMLFVFDQVRAHCMWMKNTLIPLSVAFLDEEGRILNIEDMEPLSEDNHCAARPARYALEMNKGWFAQKGIKAGAKLNGIERAPRPR